jgi:hypothetical protein
MCRPAGERRRQQQGAEAAGMRGLGCKGRRAPLAGLSWELPAAQQLGGSFHSFPGARGRKRQLRSCRRFSRGPQAPVRSLPTLPVCWLTRRHAPPLRRQPQAACAASSAAGEEEHFDPALLLTPRPSTANLAAAGLSRNTSAVRPPPPPLLHVMLPLLLGSICQRPRSAAPTPPGSNA